MTGGWPADVQPFRGGFVALGIGGVGSARPVGATPGSDITSEPRAQVQEPPGLLPAAGATDSRSTHIVRDLGAGPVVRYVARAPPGGAPLFRAAAAPGCA